MGVRGLQTFIEEHCREASPKVNIRELADRYRLEKGREPVIVVDSSIFQRRLYRKYVSDWVLGGQMKEYKELVIECIEAFHALGIKLVFFFEGYTDHDDGWVWMDRKQQSGREVEQILYYLNRWHDVSHIDEKYFQIPNGARIVSRHVIKDICNCEVHTSVGVSDREIAEYARNNECFAIMSQDTDFIIFEGAQYFFSIKSLDFRRMETINYDRVALAGHLGILPSQLPILATLIGNDIVPAYDLQKFHIDVCNYRGIANIRRDLKLLFKGVAMYISSLPDGEELFQALPAIARRAFGDEGRASQLEKSIRSYFPESIEHSEEQDEVTGDWGQLVMQAADIGFRIWVIMKYQIYTCGVTLEDFRAIDLRPAGKTTRPLRQRIYGLLFHEKSSSVDEPIVVTEWCFHGGKRIEEPDRVYPINLEGIHHPGLRTLWNEGHNELKWQIFGASVSTRINLDAELRALPPHLVIPTAALFYLTNEFETPLLQNWEVEALIALAVTLERYTGDDLKDIRISFVNVKAVRIAPLYLTCCIQMLFLLTVCGVPVSKSELHAFNYFDGKLFQSIYQRMKNGETYDDINGLQQGPLRETFLRLRTLILG